MIIKLYGKEINIRKVTQNIDGLSAENAGVAYLHKSEIIICKHNSFITLLHEIAHLAIARNGFSGIGKIEEEIVCDVFAYAIEALTRENGFGIIEKLKKFAEGNDE